MALRPASPLSRGGRAQSPCGRPLARSSSASALQPPASVAPTSGAEQLAAYVAGGPVAPLLGLASASDVDAAEWRRLGDKLAGLLGMQPDALTEAQCFRIYRYYLPVYVWLLGRLEAHRAAGSPGALVVGISAPQGCGKSTLVAALTSLLCAEGRPCVAASLDDFYLTGAQQEAVAAAHPGNPLLQYRGLPGTHDTGLAGDTLRALRALGGPGGGGGAPAAPPPAPVPVPLYDKSLRGGRGDRAPARDWPLARAPLAVVLFEGWSLGFRPLPPAALASAVASPASAAHLAPVNAFLAPYGASMDGVACAWLLLRVKDPSWVFGWRAQAEAQLRASGRPGLSDAQVADFVARFMPAYEAYLPQLYAEGPAPAGGAPTLALDVDQDRGLAGAQAMGGDGRAAGGR